MKTRVTPAALALLAALAAAAACDQPTASEPPFEDGIGGPTGGPVAPRDTSSVGSVQISGRSNTLGVGEEQQLTATVRDTTGAVLPNYPVVWESSDTTKATVSQTGVMRGRGRGIVNIRALAGGKFGGASLQIFDARVRFTPDSLVLRVLPKDAWPDFTYLYVELWDGDQRMPDASADFSVLDTTVVRLEGCGSACSGFSRGRTVKVYPLKAGSTRIVATWRGASDTATVHVAL